jgi:hypothetical protein
MSFEGLTTSLLHASRSLDSDAGLVSSDLAMLESSLPYDSRSQMHAHIPEWDESSMTSAHMSWLDPYETDTMSSSNHNDPEYGWTDSSIKNEETEMTETGQTREKPPSIVDPDLLSFGPHADSVNALDVTLTPGDDRRISATSYVIL